MMDEKEARMHELIYAYWQDQNRYMNGLRSVWGFGEHRMAEYLLRGTRRFKLHG